MIYFKNLILNNYGPYEHLEFTFEPGHHLILGKNLSSPSTSSNGAGKSTIIEAILWCSYKKSPKGSNPSKDGKGNCNVELNFEISGVIYKVIRYYGHKVHGNGVQLFIDNEEVQSRTSSVTDKEIIKILGVSFEIFASSILVMQGFPINFSVMTPTIRKTVLEDILGFNIWDNIKSLFDDSSKEFSMEHETIEGNYTVKKEKMITVNSQIEAFQAAKKIQISDVQNKKDELNIKIQEVENQFTELQSKMKEIFGKKKSKDINSELYTLKDSLTLMSNRKFDLDKILQEKICPTCTQDYPESMMSKAQKEVDKLIPKIMNLKELTESFKKEFNELQQQESQLSQLNNAKTIYKTELSSVEKKLQNKIDDGEIELLQEKLDALVTEVNEKKKLIDNLAKELKNVKYISSLLLPSSTFRTSIMERYLNYINQIIKDFCPLLLDLELNLIIDSKGNGIEFEVRRRERNVQYISLSGGEKRRLDIIVLFSLQRFLFEFSGISSNLVFFDESFESIDFAGLNAILTTLDSLFSKEVCNYVISHDDNLKSSFDSVIQVTNTNGIAIIE